MQRAEHYRHRAEEIRHLASGVKCPKLQQELEQVASEYEEWARKLEPPAGN